MKQYTLTENEARELAFKVACARAEFPPNCNYQAQVESFMDIYNKIMNAIDDYSSKH